MLSGGIADGEGVAAGFMLGAEAVQVGTRFCSSLRNRMLIQIMKAKILKARDIDSPLFRHSTSGMLSVLSKNQLTRDFETG